MKYALDVMHVCKPKENISMYKNLILTAVRWTHSKSDEWWLLHCLLSGRMSTYSTDAGCQIK